MCSSALRTEGGRMINAVDARRFPVGISLIPAFPKDTLAPALPISTEATPVSRITRSVATAFLLAIPAIATAQEAKGDAEKSPRPSIYDVNADASEQIKAATALARRDGRR